MARKLTPEDWEKIVLNRTFGKTYKEIAESVGITDGAVNTVLAAFDTVKAQDWAKCCHLIVSRNMTIEVFKWAAERCGVELPDVVLKSYDDYQARRRATRSKSLAPDLPGEPKQGNEAVYFIRILEQLNKTTELLETLLDVVIPKYIGDMKDNINANTDVLCERVKGCETSLEAVRVQLRKKGL